MGGVKENNIMGACSPVLGTPVLGIPVVKIIDISSFQFTVENPESNHIVQGSTVPN